MIVNDLIESPLGLLLAEVSGSAVISLEFTDKKRMDAEKSLTPDRPGSIFAGPESITMSKLKEEIDEYFKGLRREFTLPLEPRATDFQKKVWDKLRTIPYGETVAYNRLADGLGGIKAIRAVANANAMNPVVVMIPCHRVIGEDGSLTGYAGGLWRKKWLIDHERRISGKAFDLELFEYREH
jgi:O-6-methylguanine DNA methyltransferase